MSLKTKNLEFKTPAAVLFAALHLGIDIEMEVVALLKT